MLQLKQHFGNYPYAVNIPSQRVGLDSDEHQKEEHVIIPPSWRNLLLNSF